MTLIKPEINKTCLMFALSVAAALVTTGSAMAYEDWPNFRGPNYDGISVESGIKTKWSEKMPLLWEKTIGSAYSSFACVGKRVYTCGTEAGNQVLFCLNADNGKVIWKHAIEKEFQSEQGSGTRATPAVNDGRVYILGGFGKLLCLSAETGKEIWSQAFTNKPHWGYSGSVLIEGELAIASAGSSEGALVAFDKKTGKPTWKTGDDPVGYATPYPFTFGGKRYIVGFTGNGAIIVEAKTGKLALQIPWQTAWKINASSPIFHDGYLFLTSGYRTGCGLLKLKASGDKLQAESIWKSKVLMNKFQSCILYQGKLYSSDQNALVCADFMTGKEEWRIPHLKHGTVVLAQGQLLVLTAQGQLQIAKATPQGFDPITKADILDDRCWTVSVLYNGRLYARNLDRLVCFDLRS